MEPLDTQNNSFLYLEKESLHLVLSHLLDKKVAVPQQINLQLLDELIQHNEKAFHSIIELLKKET